MVRVTIAGVRRPVSNGDGRLRASAVRMAAVVLALWWAASQAAEPSAPPRPVPTTTELVCRAIVLEIRRADEMLGQLAETRKSAPSDAEVRSCKVLRARVEQVSGVEDKRKALAEFSECARRYGMAKDGKFMLTREESERLLAEQLREREANAEGFQRRSCGQFGMAIVRAAP